MKLSDLSTGPDWVVWIMAGLFALAAAVLFSGRGGWLIAGYNTASRKEKARYDPKRLGRVFGGGMAVIALLLAALALLEDVVTAGFAWLAAALVAADVLAMAVLANTFCKKR